MNNCILCHKTFHDSELLQSNQDEYFCKECFKYEYCAVSNRKKPAPSNRCEGDSVPKSKKMFSPTDLSVIRQQREARVNTIFTSKRPLRCPHVDCNRSVSIFDVNAHFQREHVEVPIVRTSLDVRNALTFKPKDIRYGIKECVLLLNLLPQEDGDHSQEDRDEVAEKLRVTPVTVAVLVSRIASAQLGEDSECIVNEEETELTGNNDKIIIWAASNVICNYSYTVAVSTISEEIRVKYYGPILQLGNSTQKLCKEGHCLILGHFHFLGMSENGRKPLNLDVIIHSED